MPGHTLSELERLLVRLFGQKNKDPALLLPEVLMLCVYHLGTVIQVRNSFNVALPIPFKSRSSLSLALATNALLVKPASFNTLM